MPNIDCRKIVEVTIAGQNKIVKPGTFEITLYKFRFADHDYRDDERLGYRFRDRFGSRYDGPLSAIQMVHVSG